MLFVRAQVLNTCTLETVLFKKSQFIQLSYLTYPDSYFGHPKQSTICLNREIMKYQKLCTGLIFKSHILNKSEKIWHYLSHKYCFEYTHIYAHFSICVKNSVFWALGRTLPPSYFSYTAFLCCSNEPQHWWLSQPIKMKICLFLVSK